MGDISNRSNLGYYENSPGPLGWPKYMDEVIRKFTRLMPLQRPLLFSA